MFCLKLFAVPFSFLMSQLLAHKLQAYVCGLFFPPHSQVHLLQSEQRVPNPFAGPEEVMPRGRDWHRPRSLQPAGEASGK